MSETLVVIRTFDSLIQADEAQLELMNAGIHSLLMSDDRDGFTMPETAGNAVALAVHRRDADVAFAVLVPLADQN